MNNPKVDRADAALNPVKSRIARLAVGCGFCLVLLDTTALNIAAANMGRRLGGSIGGLQSVVNSHAIIAVPFFF
jgi:hypothetical protein